MKITSRQRVFGYVADHPAATTVQIAAALRLTSAAVRHHLRVLHAEQRVEKTHRRQAPVHRGRPLEAYVVAKRLRGDNLSILVAALIDGWPRTRRESRGAAIPQSAIQALTDGLLRTLGPAGVSGSTHGRFAGLVNVLNRFHYRARWEAGARGPRIIFGNCPYVDVLGRYPQLCEMDRGALTEMTQYTAQQTGRIDPQSVGRTQCVFVLEPPHR